MKVQIKMKSKVFQNPSQSIMGFENFGRRSVGCLKIIEDKTSKTQSSYQTRGSRFNPKRGCHTPTNVTRGSWYMPNAMVVDASLSSIASQFQRGPTSSVFQLKRQPVSISFQLQHEPTSSTFQSRCEPASSAFNNRTRSSSSVRPAFCCN